MLGRAGKTERSFSPLYLAVLSGILLIILIVNGLLEITRAKKGFYLLLEREGVVLLQHFEQNIQETLSALQRLEGGSADPAANPSPSGLLLNLQDSVTEYLVEAAYRIDQIDGEKNLTSSDFQYLIGQYRITSIEIYDLRGKLLRGWPTGLPTAGKEPFLQGLIGKKRTVAIDLLGKSLAGKNARFSAAILRTVNPGIVVISLDGEQLKELLRQAAIRRAVSDIALREGIQYVSVQDARLRTLASTNPTFIEGKRDDPFLKNSLQQTQPVSRLYRPQRDEEIFEVVKSFSLNHEPVGLIRIGFSPKEIPPLLRQLKKSVALSVLFFLILGVCAITLIWVNQNRHLKKVREMEERIQLAERLSSLGHLAAGVAHEIRNPLNAIGMALQRLKREFSPQDESKREEYVSFTDLVSKEVRRVNEIIEQFLALSRPAPLNLVVGSLSDLLNHLIVLFQEEAASRGITIQAEIPSDLPLVKMDAQRLTQAFVNIMKNGMEAMDRGGVLRLEARPIGGRVEVLVSDSGSGIPPDRMEKIFNYYYTTKERGAGLGLPLAHRIIEGHGGQVNLESRPGVGTKVTVTLPLEAKGSK